MSVGITEQRPTHDFSLSDGVVTLGLRLHPDFVRGIQQMDTPNTTMRISSGASGYADIEMPYNVHVQDDWSRGRGLRNAGDDAARYLDGFRADTSGRGIIPGPKETYTTGYFGYASTSETGTSTRLVAAGGAEILAASSYTVGGAAMALRKLRFWLKAATGAIYPIKARAHIYSDSTGPGTLLASSSYVTIPKLTSTYVPYDFPLVAALSASTKYWLVLELGAAQSANVALNASVSGNKVYEKSGVGAWTEKLNNQALRISLYTTASGKAHLREYKGAMYAFTSPDDQSTPKIYMNGYRGAATSNTADKSKTNTVLNLSGVDLAGKVIKIVAGKGSLEECPERVITSNTTTGTNDSITVNPKWNIVQDTTTEFVIQGCDTWQDVSAMTGGATYAALKYPVTDVLVLEDWLYIAQGYDQSDGYIVRMKQAISSGNMATTFAADGANKAKFLMLNVTTTGIKKVWRTSDINDVSSATVPSAFGTNLAFGTSVQCGSGAEPITGITEYGAPAIPYVQKEGSFGNINNGLYAQVPLGEIASIKNRLNGKTALRHDVYLYFSLLQGLERYVTLNNHLDDVGPNRDEGMPDDRKGYISAMVGYTGHIYAAIDAGDSGYSSILKYTPGTGGWHEIYRAPYGKRIRALFIQPIGFFEYQRLWFSEEEDLVWIPVAPNPGKCVGYQFTSTCTVTSARFEGSYKDLIKFWKAVKLTVENRDAGHQDVTFEYQTSEDDEDTWHAIGDVGDDAEHLLSADYDVSGKWFAYRLTLTTDNASEYARVCTVRIDENLRIIPKRTWTVNFIIDDTGVNMQGLTDVQSSAAAYSLNASQLLAQLRTWINSQSTPCPLLMRSNHAAFDDLRVFIDPKSLRMLEQDAEGHTLRGVYNLVLWEA